MTLPPPQQFRPWLSGKYTVSAGLSKLEGPALLFDTDTRRYLAEKSRLLAAKPSHHIAYRDFPSSLESAVLSALGSSAATLDAFARQVPEDIAVLRVTSDGRDVLAALHVAFPNGWDPREKIGQSFFQTHELVPHIGPINAKASHFARVMTTSPTRLIRFVWGLRFDDYLDHHPESPVEEFDPENPRIFIRVERQTIIPVPPASAAVFLIRTYVYPHATLTTHERAALAAAIEGMSEASATYKGITPHRHAIVAAIR